MAHATPDIEILLDDGARRATLLEDARRGLGHRPLQLSPMWLYDRRGSELFDRITHLPEYYLTGAESRLLRSRGGEIADRAAADTLIELGSGASEKTDMLLNALAAGGLRRCVLVDVSVDALRSAITELSERHPGLAVRGVVGDFHQHAAAAALEGTRRMVALLGSTIGNLNFEQRAAFFRRVVAVLGAEDTFLVGFDLAKAPARMIAAYDDARGLTAQFNRNALYVVNAELGANFYPGNFDHVAVWEPAAQWMAMHLRARGAQHVQIPALELSLVVESGETIRTEISMKFRLGSFTAELRDAGLEVARTWSTPGEYALVLARRAPEGLRPKGRQ